MVNTGYFIHAITFMILHSEFYIQNITFRILHIWYYIHVSTLKMLHAEYGIQDISFMILHSKCYIHDITFRILNYHRSFFPTLPLSWYVRFIFLSGISRIWHLNIQDITFSIFHFDITFRILLSGYYIHNITFGILPSINLIQYVTHMILH